MLVIAMTIHDALKIELPVDAINDDGVGVCVCVCLYDDRKREFGNKDTGGVA